MERPIPTPTADALRELGSLHSGHSTLDDYEDRLAPLALAYDNHRRQFRLLMTAHAPLTLFILVFAVAGGHLHTVQTVLLVYSVLFLSFVAAITVFGVQTRHIWMPRAFGLALFGIALWSTLSVVYAVYTQIRMRQWYDITLLCAQGIDIAITVAYFYTAEMLAGIGGEASAVTAEMHYSGVMLSPLAAHLGDAASANHAALQPSRLTRTLDFINSVVSADPRARRRRVHND